jgi:hypothetical protein
MKIWFRNDEEHDGHDHRKNLGGKTARLSHLILLTKTECLMPKSKKELFPTIAYNKFFFF